MNSIGFRILKETARPSKELLEMYKSIPVANIADNMGRISCVQTAIKPFNKLEMTGAAFTVHVPGGDNLMFHKALDMANEGDVIVVDGEGWEERSLCGEIMFTYAVKRKLGGFLIDGCIRDVASLEKLPLPVFARGITPRGPYKNGPGEINFPVSIGGQVVNPGDIIRGDMDGVVIIRSADAEAVLEKAIAHNEGERRIFEQIQNGSFDRSWIDKALEAGGCEVI